METVVNDLRDRVAVITGGARGMGRAYVRAFLSAGAKVVATDRSWSGVDEFREELKSHEKNVLVRTWMLRKMRRLIRLIKLLWISLRPWIFSLTMLRCVHAIYTRLKAGRRRSKPKIRIGRGSLRLMSSVP